MDVLPACTSVHHTMPCALESYSMVRLPGVTDTCESTCEHWELNLSPLEKQPVLLTTEPSLYSLFKGFKETDCVRGKTDLTEVLGCQQDCVSSSVGYVC